MQKVKKVGQPTGDESKWYSRLHDDHDARCKELFAI